MSPIRYFLLPLATILAISLAPASSLADRTGPCGNGTVNSGEECDDGDNTPGDGCGIDCTVQEGWTCTGSPSVCTRPPNTCGDGVVDANESCDDGNRENGDGCDLNCFVQPGFICTGSPSSCAAGSNEAECGNGLLTIGEECDDGNETAADGCSDCQIDAGWGCTGVPSVCGQTGGGGEEGGGEICRGASFWARRATLGPDSQSVVDIVLDAVGSLQVCGRTIDSSTELGDLDSAVEALCVQPRGIEERELFRQLVTAELNCAISDGGTCGEITDPFMDVSLDDCDALCAGTPVPGSPTLEDCIDQLECFNEGGRVVEGNCATGTCENDPSQLCGEDFEPCVPLVVPLDGEVDEDLEDDSCEDFEGNCADAHLCQSSTNADVQICDKTRPTNNGICREARRNDCTIDDCD